MKKYFLLGLIVAIAPGICLGAGARYTQLVREKQRKMAELEKCMGATNGLKIAGISTLGLTAVGVAGNIAEAKTRDTWDANIKKAESEISNFDKEIAAEQKKIDDKKAEAKRIAEEEEKAKAEGRAALSKASYAINCRLSGGTPLGDDRCMCKLGKKPDSTGKCGLDTEEKIQVISQQPTVKGPELTGVVSGNNNFMWNPVGTGDTTATSDSPTPISTDNNNLPTSQPEMSDGATNESGSVSTTNKSVTPNKDKANTGLTNAQTYPAGTFLQTSEGAPNKDKANTGLTNAQTYPAGTFIQTPEGAPNKDKANTGLTNAQTYPAGTFLQTPEGAPNKDKANTGLTNAQTYSAGTFLQTSEERVNKDKANTGLTNAQTYPAGTFIQTPEGAPNKDKANTGLTNTQTYSAGTFLQTPEGAPNKDKANTGLTNAQTYPAGTFLQTSEERVNKDKANTGLTNTQTYPAGTFIQTPEGAPNKDKANTGLTNTQTYPAGTFLKKQSQNNPQQKTNQQKNISQDDKEICWQKLDSYDGVDKEKLVVMLDGSCKIVCIYGYNFNPNRRRCETKTTYPMGSNTGYIK